MRCPAIGLTGEAGSGKSRILAWLAGEGAECQDADQVVRDLLATDPAVASEVGARFGKDVLVQGPPLHVDRRRLAARAFGHAEALADLEGILHPRVTRQLSAWMKRARSGTPNPAALAIEAIKLLEAGLTETLGLDGVWLAVCDLDLRRERLLARGWSLDESERRSEALRPLGWRLAQADVVIDTTGEWPATVVQLEFAWRRLVRRDAGRGNLSDEWNGARK